MKKVLKCDFEYCDVCPFPCYRHELNEAERKRMKMAKTYTVKKGDTLSSIAMKQLGKANRYNEIMCLNGLKTTVIKVGQVLKLPPKGSETVSDTSERYVKLGKQFEKALNDISKLDSVKTLCAMLGD